MSLMKVTLASKLVIGACKVTMYVGEFVLQLQVNICTYMHMLYKNPSICSICLPNLNRDGIALAVALLTEVSL